MERSSVDLELLHVVSALVAALAAVFGWLWSRMTHRLDRLEERTRLVELDNVELRTRAGMVRER